jgi:hypothetical protein
VRAIPWVLILRGGIIVGEGIGQLPPRDRARLARLLRDSRGWPGRLSTKERAELRGLIGKLDLKGMGRELTPLMRGSGRRRKRR